MSKGKTQKERRAQIERMRRDLYALVKALKARPCADCKRTFDAVCMDFDHRPGTEKLFSLNHLGARAVEKVRAEIAKCDLVCANCHRIRTRDRLRDGSGNRGGRPLKGSTRSVQTEIFA